MRRHRGITGQNPVQRERLLSSFTLACRCLPGMTGYGLEADVQTLAFSCAECPELADTEKFMLRRSTLQAISTLCSKHDSSRYGEKPRSQSE